MDIELGDFIGVVNFSAIRENIFYGEDKPRPMVGPLHVGEFVLYSKKLNEMWHRCFKEVGQMVSSDPKENLGKIVPITSNDKLYLAYDITDGRYTFLVLRRSERNVLTSLYYFYSHSILDEVLDFVVEIARDFIKVTSIATSIAMRKFRDKCIKKTVEGLLEAYNIFDDSNILNIPVEKYKIPSISVK